MSPKMDKKINFGNFMDNLKNEEIKNQLMMRGYGLK